MTDIFDEAKEEWDQERFLLAIKRYTKPVIILIIIGLASLALWTFWEARTAKQRSVFVQELAEAVRNSPLPADKQVEALAHLSAQHAHSLSSLAALYQGALLVKQEKWTEAIEVYEQLSKRTNQDKAIRQLAQLLMNGLRLKTIVLQKENSAHSIAEALQPLTSAEAAWTPSARFMQGAAYMQAGMKEQARLVFKQLVEEEHDAQFIRQNAEKWLSLLHHTPASSSSKALLPAVEEVPHE